MGNTHNNSYVENFNISQWKQIPISQQQPHYSGQYHRYQHLKTKQILQKYSLIFSDQQDYKSYLQSFYWRLHQQSIVSTKYLQQNIVKEFCSATFTADVYIQNIPIRLSQVTDIPYPQNLYVLYSLMEGYQKIHHFLGYLKPKENQICVNSQGYVKVWINSNLSKNYPETDDLIQTKQVMTETMMVKEIVALISQNTDQQSQPYSLKQYILKKGKNNLTFNDAKMIISQYSKQYKTPIPSCFESVLQMFNQDFNHFQQNQANIYNENFYGFNNMVPNNQKTNFQSLKVNKMPQSKISAPGQIQNQQFNYNHNFNQHQGLSNLFRDKNNNKPYNLNQSKQISQSQLTKNKFQSKIIDSQISSFNIKPNTNQNTYSSNNNSNLKLINTIDKQTPLIVQTSFNPYNMINNSERQSISIQPRPKSNIYYQQNSKRNQQNLILNQFHIPINFNNKKVQIRTYSDRDRVSQTSFQNFYSYGRPRIQTVSFQQSQIVQRNLLKRPQTYNQHLVHQNNYLNFNQLNQPKSSAVNFNVMDKVFHNKQIVMNNNINHVNSKPIPAPVSRNNFVKNQNYPRHINSYPRSNLIQNNNLKKNYKGNQACINSLQLKNHIQKEYQYLDPANVRRFTKISENRQTNTMNFNQVEPQILKIQQSKFEKLLNNNNPSAQRTNKINIDRINLIEQESSKPKNYRKIQQEQNFKQIHYYTKNTEAQIDPQIARDLALYSQLGQI